MILCPSRVLANIITSSLWVALSQGRLLPEIQKKLKAHVVFVQLGVCPDFGWIIYIPVDIVRSWWSKWEVVMAAQHCYPWWRWSGLIICEHATLIRLWLHSLSGYLQSVLWRFFCNFHRYVPDMYPLSTFITCEQMVEIIFSFCRILWLSNH
jgi:hypothetical protein